MRVKVIIVLIAAWFAFQWVGKVRVHEVTVDPKAQATWMTDATAALAKARSENKLVLMDFTGSDWCGWCIKLDEEVFSTPEFASYAKNSLVLLKVDFPRGKKQPASEVQQNEMLAHKYGVTGFPTIIVLSPGGQEKGRLGYQPGGPKAWLAALDGVR